EDAAGRNRFKNQYLRDPVQSENQPALSEAENVQGHCVPGPAESRRGESPETAVSLGAHLTLMLKETDPQRFARFFEDSSGMPGGHAESVVFPQNAAEVAEVLRDANAHKTPVTIAGNGTGITGARVPFGGCVLATERMDRIFDIGIDLQS